MGSFKLKDVSMHEDLESKLAALGFNRDNFRVLTMLPSVYAAWSDGEISPGESDEIMEIAGRQKFLAGQEIQMLREWITNRPTDAFFEEGLHLLSLILSSVPDEVEYETPRDILGLAKSVARASGGFFGIIFTIGSEEHTALREIEKILKTTQRRSWKKLIKRLRVDWFISDWKIIEEPLDVSKYDPGDPFLFTAPEAIDDYKAGLFVKPNGAPITPDDLKRDLKNEVMRAESWLRMDMEYRVIQDTLLENGWIEAGGVYWNNSPHAGVYTIKDNVKIYIEGKEYRLRKGEQMAFQCRMSRDTNRLDGPFMTGHFMQTSDSMLCSDMSNAMLGMGGMRTNDMDKMKMKKMPAGGMPMNKMQGMASTPLPDIDLKRIKINDGVKIIYIIIDTSGSMEGGPLEQARAALMSFLQNIPMNPKMRIGIRRFSTDVGPLEGSLQNPYDMTTKRYLMEKAKKLAASGCTALYRTVNKSLDDIQRLVKDNQVPKAYLIVLSDGEDNKGSMGVHYGGMEGLKALIGRMRDFREAGIAEYIPIAYGGEVESLDMLGGAGFHCEVTKPSGIMKKFSEIRRRLMVGIPMNM